LSTLQVLTCNVVVEWPQRSCCCDSKSSQRHLQRLATSCNDEVTRNDLRQPLATTCNHLQRLVTIVVASRCEWPQISKKKKSQQRATSCDLQQHATIQRAGCVAVCCSVLQCVVECCSVLQRLQRAAKLATIQRNVSCGVSSAKLTPHCPLKVPH